MLPMAKTEAVFFPSNGQIISGNSSQTSTLSSPFTPESDVDDLVEIFLDVDVKLNNFRRLQTCDLQLGDSWRGMQGKMSVTAPVQKIRKKCDNKPPQSQLNKCFNEKKRRELENETINQLEELLGACLAEVKQPDKNGVVREATRRIHDVFQQRRECPEECPNRATHSASPLQAGEVTSTQPPTDDHYSEIYNLLEALKHYTNTLDWVLIELNNKGEIQCVTDNIKDIILKHKRELYKKPIFSLLHVNDHTIINTLLGNLQKVESVSESIDKYQIINVHFLQQATASDVPRYVEVVIHAKLVRGSCAEEAGSVMCVIRRCKDASAAHYPVDGGPPALLPKQLDQITFRLDPNYYIINCDLSGVDYNILPPSLVGTRILDLIETSDRLSFATHLREASSPPAPPAISDTFRIRITPDGCWIKVRAQSRLFRANPVSSEIDFIMSTHIVLNDEDDNPIESKENQPSVSGPIMSSVTNGESSGCDNSSYRSMSPSPFLGDFSINDLDPWGQAFSFGEMPEEVKEERKENSCEVLTPRNPNTPTDTAPNTPLEEPNRLRLLLSKKTSGDGGSTSDSNNRILKDLLKQEDEEATSSETSAPQTPHTPHTPHTPAAAVSPLQSAPAPVRVPPSAVPHHSSDMLLRILNEKSEEHPEDGRRNDNSRNTSQPSALLSQLLSSSNGPSSNGERMPGVKRKFDEAKGPSQSLKRATPEMQHQVSSSAITVASSSPSGSSPTTSGGLSDLCQRNRILVGLLARQQPTPTTPPSLPTPTTRQQFETRIRQTAPAQHTGHPHPSHGQQRPHHSHLSNMLVTQGRSGAVNGGAGLAEDPASHLQLVLQGPRGTYPPPNVPSTHNPHYATTAPHHVYNNHPQGGNVRPHSGNGGNSSECEQSDQVLSDILDEVINNLSEGERPDALMVMAPNRQIRIDYPNIKEEENVINAIRQSLMQCEKVSKSPVTSSPSGPPVYPVHSPQGTCNMGSSMYTMGAGRSADSPRAGVEQHRERLLHMQRSQQLLVSPEAAEQPQPDLGATISALVSGTPPNVALTRTDFHHLYHQTNQLGSSYGTHKMASTQQSPMLSRQLSAAYSPGVSHTPAALHTPLMQHYHRAPPRPTLGGYYDDAGARAGGPYCAEYSRRAPHHDTSGGNIASGNVASGGATSEYVRNELRAVVGARSSRPDLHHHMQPDLDTLSMAFDMPTPGGGSALGGRASSATTNTWESQQNTPSTTAAAAGAAVGAAAAARGDEAAQGSLLQKLLSE